MSAGLESLRRMLLLAGLTWREGLRRRMLQIGFLLTLLFIALFGLGAYFAFRNWQDVVPAEAGELAGLSTTAIRDMGAYQLVSFGIFISTFLGAMLVVFMASGMISGDAENGTLQTIVTRPIGRAQLLVGRYLGYASIFFVYIVLLAGSLIVLTCIFAGYIPHSPIISLLFLVLQGCVLLAVVGLSSSVLSSLATGILTFMLFGFGFVGGIVRQIGLFLDNDTAAKIGRAIHYLIPSDAFFRMALHDLVPESVGFSFRAAGPFGAPTAPSALLIGYGLLYLVAVLAAAGFAFRRKDL